MKDSILFTQAIIWLSLISISCTGQKPFEWKDHVKFDTRDTLRGSLTGLRTAFDVKYYDLNLEVHPEDRSIKGTLVMRAFMHQSIDSIQLDLFPNLDVLEIQVNNEPTNYRRLHSGIFIPSASIDSASSFEVRVDYKGTPIAAKRAPWDGGFVWSEDKQGNPWIAVACEGTGASLWWPNKDHLSDEPDSMRIAVTVPNDLVCISNGDLERVIEKGDKSSYHWFVEYPINNYNVTLNIGNYIHFSEEYTHPELGVMPLDYYVLEENESKARKHFKQTSGVLKAFENWFGPYPYWNDGFALVETPYLGMEHQSAIAYGNKYMRGYLGYLKPDTLDFDYIIVHETGHEYWGNSVSCGDMAEIWIHESFTTYMEALYVEEYYGYELSKEYLLSQKRHVRNNYPLVGPIGVNFHDTHDSDAYYKGSWILHTLRSVLGPEHNWRKTMRDVYELNKHQVVNSSQIIESFNKLTNRDLRNFFSHYLHQPHLPVFSYKLVKEGDKKYLEYSWTDVKEGFEMPFEIKVKNVLHRLNVTTKVQRIDLSGAKISEIEFALDRFLVDTHRVL